MKWIVVKTYGNGKYMQQVYPMWFEYLSQAEKMCKELNESYKDDGSSDKWVAMPLAQYLGSVW
jgi:hypothetical protein